MKYDLEWNVNGGSIYYRKEAEGIYITRYRGRIKELIIPDRIEDTLVVGIKKKSFLGCKSLQFVKLPGYLSSIEDWAFAQCSFLEMVVMPKKDMMFGQGVFLKDKRLRHLYLFEKSMSLLEETDHRFSTAKMEWEKRFSAEETQYAELFAASLQVLKADYLLNPLAVGTREWIDKWDFRMLTILHEEDEEGYHKMVLCGEEDLSANYEEYLAENRRRKARLSFIRLLNPIGMAAETKEELVKYLQEHTKGCESEASWEVVSKEFGDEKPYFELLLELGCITNENFDGMLSDLGDRHAETKAYLINHREEQIGTEDFFDSLML
ncbi:MAG: leucine-rich repeat protein [Lachnospiraceae bacterium]|nr:leucine-rich repeat protein [Lachnospiraceae bacterium]